MGAPNDRLVVVRRRHLAGRRSVTTLRSTRRAVLVLLAVGLLALLLTARPEPALSSPAGQVTLTWTVPDRYADTSGDGRPDPGTTPGAVNPGSWRVDLAARGACAGAATRSWWIEGVELASGDPKVLAGGPGSCALSYAFPDEGVYEVAVEGRDSNGKLLGYAKEAVTVQDFLIVSIGDSVASGEGNSEVPGGAPVWQDRQCHRSSSAGPARAAQAVEQASPRTSVTFVHLACSGATVTNGLLGGYRGIERGAMLPPQVTALGNLVGDREIDAVLVSVGANDVQFSVLVEYCFLRRACDLAVGPLSAATLFARLLPGLPGRYNQLAGALTTRSIAADRVYLTEYFDPTRDDAGQPCDRTILSDHPLARVFAITADEAAWASNVMLTSLNAEVASAASRHGWRFVGGITSQFLTHGYCAADHWVVRFGESQANQGDENGTLHPNAPGHDAYGRRITSLVNADLLVNGSPGSPRRPFRRLELQGKGPAEPDFGDVVGAVEPKDTVVLRTRLAGDGVSGQTVSYTLTGPGALSATSGSTNSSGEHTVTYQAPASGCPDGPVCATVTASFTDADGMHTDSLTVAVEEVPVTVTVTPASVVLAPGQTQQFSAAVTGVQNPAVTWSADGGAITSGGVFTAPTSAGVYTVTAQSVEKPSAMGTANVEVRVLNWWWQGTSMEACNPTDGCYSRITNSGAALVFPSRDFPGSYELALSVSPFGTCGPYDSYYLFLLTSLNPLATGAISIDGRLRGCLSTPGPVVNDSLYITGEMSKQRISITLRTFADFGDFQPELHFVGAR